MSKPRVIQLDGGKPWGFKIAGGYELNQPIIVTNVSLFIRS